MIYERIEPAVFKERPNRFVAHVETEKGREICHVKNTGRCRELLISDTPVYVQRNEKPGRKTPLDLITVQKGNRLVNLDSQAPNQVAFEWLQKGNLFSKQIKLKREQRYGNSRFDIYAEDKDRRAFMEVKGVTLEEDGVARFPDAPTERGVKHLKELCECVRNGYEAYLLFVIQMEGIRWLEPNWNTHAAFGEAMREAKEAGVKLLAYDCLVEKDRLEIKSPVEIRI